MLINSILKGHGTVIPYLKPLCIFNLWSMAFMKVCFHYYFILKLHNFTEFKTTPIRPQWSTTHFTLLNTIMSNVLLVRVRRGHIYDHLWKLRKRFDGLIRFRPFWCRKKYWSPFPNLTAPPPPFFKFSFFICLFGVFFLLVKMFQKVGPPPTTTERKFPNPRLI